MTAFQVISRLAVWLALWSMAHPAASAEAGVREKLVAQLHLQCMTDLEGLQAGVPRREVLKIEPRFIPQFCNCANEGIRKDPMLDHIAAMLPADRQETSKEMFYLRLAYFVEGLPCLPRPKRNRGDANQLPDRPISDVKETISRRASDFYTPYKLALARRAGLAGKVILEFRIEPTGAVSKVEIRSSTLHDDQLERDLVTAISAINFGARTVRPLVLTYPIELVPD